VDNRSVIPPRGLCFPPARRPGHCPMPGPDNPPKGGLSAGVQPGNFSVFLAFPIFLEYIRSIGRRRGACYGHVRCVTSCSKSVTLWRFSMCFGQFERGLRAWRTVRIGGHRPFAPDGIRLPIQVFSPVVQPVASFFFGAPDRTVLMGERVVAPAFAVSGAGLGAFAQYTPYTRRTQAKSVDKQSLAF
jgi:hypothetical protein